MVWNVLLTITTDFTWRLDLEIWPGDMTRRLDPETWPGDLTQRLDPETWPRDLTRRLDPETSYRDFTQRLHPKTHLEWSFFIISCLQIWSQKFFKFVWRCEKKTDFQRFCKMCLSCLAHSEYVWWFYWVFLDFHGNIMGNDVSQKYST